MKLNKTTIGMVHAGALPGTPQNRLPAGEVRRQAVAEAQLLARCGMEALLLENMHDRPYLNRQAGPEVVATLAVIAAAIKAETGLPTGIQVLAGANREALAIALAANLDFIRAEGFVFAHLADEGWMDSDAGNLLRYRKQIGADHIQIFTDIKKKHSSHAVTADISMEETARAAGFFLSDGLIVTGSSTGEPADPAEAERVKKCTPLPVIIGSGITADNLHRFWTAADAFIVGSSLKTEGKWYNPVEESRVRAFVGEVNKLRNPG